MEKCRVVLSPFDSEVRLESLLAFICTDVFSKYRSFRLEVAQDRDCLTLVSGLYDRFSFAPGSSVVSTWDRRHDDAFLADSLLLKRYVEELAEAIGLLVHSAPPTAETESDHRLRVREAIDRRGDTLEVIVVPVETMKLICESLNIPISSIVAIQSRLPKARKLADFKRFCEVYSMGMYREDCGVATHCAAMLRQNQGCVVVNVEEDRLVVRRSPEASEEQVRTEASRLLEVINTLKEQEEQSYGYRKEFYKTVLRNLRHAWESVTLQLTSLCSPPQPDISLSSLQAEIKQLESYRQSDQTQFRKIPSLFDYEELQKEIAQLRGQLAEKTTKYEQIYSKLTSETLALKRTLSEYQSAAYLNSAYQSPPLPVELSYQGNSETQYVLRAKSDSAISNVYLEVVSGQSYHRCVSHLDLPSGLRDITVHKHFSTDVMKYVLRTAEGVVSNELTLPRTDIKVEEVALTDKEIMEVENTLTVLGHDNIKPAIVHKITSLLRFQQLSHLDIVSELCRVTVLS